MANKELNCKWYFGPQDPANRKGPNNPTTMSFKDEDFNSLVRESVQNSLDAVKDNTKPVEVSFAKRSFSGGELPEFFKLKDHIQGCLDEFPGNENAQKRFGPMLDYFSGGFIDRNISYLRIVDRNTTGMSYSENDPHTGFYKFLAEGVAQDKEGAGGAFGFGKDAFWALSPISTVFVSSRTESQVNFAGLAKLCTHVVNGEELVSNGQYCTNGQGLVISEEDKIPEEFRPKEIGTSVFVMGINSIDEAALIRSVLRNFWAAIHKGKLVVKVERDVVDKSSLPELMKKYFSGDDEKEEIANHKCSPREMYDIFVGAENSAEDYKYIEGTVMMNGQECGVKLYMHKSNEPKGGCLFMRSPLMRVDYEKNACKGADCIFICDTEYGNNFLRMCENYKHDGWKREYYGRRNPNSIVATRAINGIKEFVKESVRTELQQDAPETEQIIGLDKILTISTPKGADDESHKDDIVDPDNILTKKNKSEKKKETTSTIRKPQQRKAKFDAEGRLLSNSGGRKKKRSINPGPIKPGTLKNKSTEDENGKLGIYAVPVDVSYRTWCQTDEQKRVWHVIRIFSNEEIDNALIQLYGVGEEGKPEGLKIEEAPGFEIRNGEEFVDNTDFEDTDSDSKANVKQVKNALGGVHINENIPLTIKVRFNSDIKYSLRINSDRIETSNESK